MGIAVYVIYELITRFQDLNPYVGNYLSNKNTLTGIIVRTTTGQIAISEDILSRQFSDPGSITNTELLSMMDKFELSGRVK